MKLSARTQISRTVTPVTPVAVNGTVKPDLGLPAGDPVAAFGKASDILIGK
jgi:molybdopterin-binding protein